MSWRKCGYLGCPVPAQYLIRQPYDCDLYRCIIHVDETAEVHSKFANRQSDGIRVIPL